jgi:DNA-binding beta-propeller fold protein YncE
MHTHLARLLLFALLISLFAGCAAKEVVPRIVWPPPPDKPRLELIGVVYSEYSLKKANGKNVLDRFVGATDSIMMSTPFGVVSDSKGKVYVSDVHQKNVWVFNFNDNKVELLSRNSAMQSPSGLALDDQGRIYVADSGKGAVWVYGVDGKPLQLIGENEINKPSYLAIDTKSQRLFVSDGKAHKIYIFDLQGNLVKSFGEPGREPGQLFSPQGMAIGPDGNLYVADMFNARVQFFTTSGEYVGTFGERGDQVGQFENPKDVSFDSDGNLYVVDGRNSNLMTFTPDGKLLLVTGAGQPSQNITAFAAPRSVFVDANDRIYVAEAIGKRFAVWQYMSPAYLQKNPYTQADEQALLKYLEKIKAQDAE